MVENLGQAIIREMASRRQLGRYFTYRELKALKRVRGIDDLENFLQATSFAGLQVDESPARVVDALENYRGDFGFPGAVLYAICDALLFGIPGMIFFYFFMKQATKGAKEELAEWKRSP